MSRATASVLPSMPPSATPATAGACASTWPSGTTWGRSRRLRLREFVAGDEPALVAMHRDPRVRALLIDDFPLSDPAVAARFVTGIAAIYRRHDGLGIWHAARVEDPASPASVATDAAAPADAGDFVGWFSLMPMTGRPHLVELGARLRPAAWGGGLAQEGGEHLLDHALFDLGLDGVWAACAPGNRSALALLAAMGFESMGLLPYADRVASHHRLRLNAWATLRHTSPGSRLRDALRRSPPEGRPPRPSRRPTEEPCP